MTPPNTPGNDNGTGGIRSRGHSNETTTKKEIHVMNIVATLPPAPLADRSLCLRGCVEPHTHGDDYCRTPTGAVPLHGPLNRHRRTSAVVEAVTEEAGPDGALRTVAVTDSGTAEGFTLTPRQARALAVMLVAAADLLDADAALTGIPSTVEMYR